MRKNSLYLENGYLNIPYIMGFEYPFNFLIYARGTGKTFGALKYAVEAYKVFLYMRRSEIQLDMLKTPFLSPFLPINKKLGWNIQPKALTRHSCIFYDASTESSPVGFGAALSDVHNLRGAGLESINFMIYDEFIGENNEIKVKDEAGAFFNAYETINRNRELEGQLPLQTLLISNSDNIKNPILEELNLINVIEKMQKKHKEMTFLPKKGISITLPIYTPIVEQKRTTALYKATSGTKYNKMALDNEFFNFKNNDEIKSKDLIEYKPIITIDGICIYKHKSKREYYVSPHISGSPLEFKDDLNYKEKFRKRYGFFWDLYLKNKIIFENKSVETIFTLLFVV